MERVQIVGSQTHLRWVAVGAGVLLLEGWSASPDSGPLAALEVTCSGRTFECRDFKRVFRPEVKARLPEYVRDANCGFELHMPLSPEEERRAHLIALTPVFERGEGNILVHLIHRLMPLPAREDINRIGGGDFLPDSLEFCGYFLQLAGLRPTEDVLDVGCGVGRMAYSLAHYLAPTAHYDGFDVVEKLVRRCRETITTRFPNFVFQKVDLYNGDYNPGGSLSAADFTFPYGDGKFDFVFLTSVFTHIRAPEVRHYFDEIHRVLKPGGRCLATFFLLNRESQALVKEGESKRKLVHRVGECFTDNLDCPEACIGYEEESVRRWLAERRFRLAETYYGAWCGRRHFTSWQDILLFYK